MTHDELENEIAKAISGAPFPTPRSLTKAEAVLAAIREAGFAIVPVAPTEAMLRAGIAEYDGGGLANDIWDAMIKAAQEGKP